MSKVGDFFSKICPFLLLTFSQYLISTLFLTTLNSFFCTTFCSSLWTIKIRSSLNNGSKLNPVWMPLPNKVSSSMSSKRIFPHHSVFLDYLSLT
ncbi:hypothetical protein THIOM_001104 [Candidatus Thiomargarita nelsonii]|uniref:Uncharacterized protein n=1 Tax=Candidatus Thiomargarita nelsonii TaxID=1003181 RepID=A0A176S4N0_9GAMM|nr:hypothetical protein THIOM_001104 [Candidatus Thiomargarita nelsonii]